MNHQELHDALDMLSAQYIHATGNRISETTIFTLMEWSNSRINGLLELEAQFASTKEEPKEEAQSPSHQQRHQEAQERGDFNPWKDTKSAPNHLGDGC